MTSHTPRVADHPEPIRARLKVHFLQGGTLRLLLVGGNETQEHHDEKIRSYFRAEFPGLEVDFEHTPRTSHWDQYYARIKGWLGRYDGVVLMSLMRTNMGSSLRALANQQGKPWFPCAGTGRTFIQDAILKAAYTLIAPGSEGPPRAAPPL